MMSVSTVPLADATLVDVKTVAQMLGCSSRTVYRLSDSGRMPRPVRLGSLVRWRADEVRDWIDSGCKLVRVVKGAGK